jgi:hypothetical protein
MSKLLGIDLNSGIGGNNKIESVADDASIRVEVVYSVEFTLPAITDAVDSEKPVETVDSVETVTPTITASVKLANPLDSVDLLVLITHRR